MSTATAELQQDNLISQLSADIIKKNIQPYQGRSIQEPLARNERIDLFVEEVDTDNYENTIVFQNKELGQKITIKRLSSMYDFDKTKDVLVDDGNGGKVLPFNQGGLVYDEMAEKGCPVGITIKDIKEEGAEEATPVYVGVNQAFLNSSKDGLLMRKAYETMGYDPNSDALPLIVRKKNMNGADVENWRLIRITMIVPHFN